ncbi:MAG: dUTP diphosphatase [Rothia sp. (in: high G+C Gram-positive bacteria)]|nr:dUTP diphosphatase [Rothia sp. (in: high G+C Gram-positive bacteria)]
MKTEIKVELKVLDPGLELPAYAQAGDAGADLRSRVDLTLEPGQRQLVPTGIALALPSGYVGLVHPRSGLAARHGITVVNAPGTVDSGYRGEIMVCLLNTDQQEPFEIKRGDRIAQLVIQEYVQAQFVVVDELDSTERGSAGFGSTGLA